MKVMRKILIIILCLEVGGVVAFFALNAFKKSEEVTEPLPKGYAEIAEEKIGEMTLDEKIGQMLFVRVPSFNALEEVKKYNFGGYILFDRDIEGKTLESLAKKIESWQDASKIKMFISIDEEGGTVSRLSYNGLADFKSPQELFASGGFELLNNAEKEKIKTLEKAGINVNFAPVADTCTNKKSFIYARSFGKNAAETAEFVKNIVEDYNGTKISATLKHFPGYGSNADTHFGAAIDERSLDEFRQNDFLPFKAGIEAGASFIMVSHNIIKNVDAESPASLSKPVHDILVEELGFQGIIITDDLAMAAVAEFYNGEYPEEVQAVLAGNNMLVVSDYKTAFSNIKNAVENGVISENEIEEAIMPVILEKMSKNLL